MHNSSFHSVEFYTLVRYICVSISQKMKTPQVPSQEDQMTSTDVSHCHTDEFRSIAGVKSLELFVDHHQIGIETVLEGRELDGTRRNV